MKERYVISDTLVAWYGSSLNGRKLQGLSIFTQTIDTFNPAPAASRFKDWLVCCQTASGVSSELIGVGQAGHFDPLITQYAPWFDSGNLISCPSWQYQSYAPMNDPTLIVGTPPGPGPDLAMVIRKLGI